MSTVPHDESLLGPQEHDEPACGDCPIATGRRDFLRDMALAALGAVGAVAVSPAVAHAVRAVRPVSATRMERVYDIPGEDSVSIDEDNEVILVRWQRRAYAFSSRCTHRGARLEWRQREGRVFCPKHKARFRPDGAYDSGRSTRDLDRYEIRRRGGELAIDLAVLYRIDRDPQAWSRAFVQIA